MEYLQKLSRQIRRLFLYPHPLRYLIAQRVDARFRKKTKSYYERIIQGDVRRSNYAWCMYEAARLAKVLGEKKISILEFGVAGGMGLVHIEKHAEQIEKEFDIKFECFGFGLESGLPESSDYRDLLFQHSPNSFKMDLSKLELDLTQTKLVIGNVETTVKTFFRQYEPSPIGAIIFDLDYYTSTRDALAIFSESQKYYLPRIHLYFDNIKMTNEFVGELLAISEFNSMNEKKKIAHPYKFEQYLPNIESGERIFTYHDFSHPRYNHNSSIE